MIFNEIYRGTQWFFWGFSLAFSETGSAFIGDLKVCLLLVFCALVISAIRIWFFRLWMGFFDFVSAGCVSTYGVRHALGHGPRDAALAVRCGAVRVDAHLHLHDVRVARYRASYADRGGGGGGFWVLVLATAVAVAAVPRTLGWVPHPRR
jgi:hypothetical protein